MEFVGKCLFLEENNERVLVVGDLHLGYEESLNDSGVLISRKMFEEMISYFDLVFEKIGRVDKVVLLGDVKHEFGGILRQEWRDVLGLFDYLGEKCEGIIIIRGNHDNYLKNIAGKNSKVRVEDYFVFKGNCFLHGDRDFKESYGSGIRRWIVGHGHPAIRLSDGIKEESYKCFLVGDFQGREVIVVPSFFEYNVGTDVRSGDLGIVWGFDLERFNVKIVGDGLDVLDFGLLGDL